jgi:hypothetical protein
LIKKRCHILDFGGTELLVIFSALIDSNVG